MRCASISRTATSSHRKLSAIRLPTLPHCLPRFSSIIICSLALLAACDSAGPKFKSTDITGVEYGRTLELTDQDRKSTRLNSSHGYISYAVFCLKKKKTVTVSHPQCVPTSTSPPE